MTRFRTLLAALALVGVTTGTARAGGFLTSRFAAEEGHVTTSHPSASYYNPAGLAMRGGTRIAVEGSLGYRTVGYNRPPAAIDNQLSAGEAAAGTPSDAVSANSGRATLSDIVAVPFFGVASDLGVRNLGVGLSLSVPFGGSAAWDKNEEYEGSQAYPGAVDGVQRWTVIEGSVRALYVSAAAAYYFEPARLSLGLSGNFISQEVLVLRARNAAATDDLVNADGSISEGRSLIDVTGNSFSLGAGLIWAPVDTVRIGLSYQSKPDFGKSTLEGELTNKFGNAATGVSPIVVEQTLPDVIRFGGAVQASNKLDLRAQVEWQRWSAFDRQCILDANNPDRNCAINADGSTADDAEGVLANIDRDWHDSFAVRIGATYHLSDAIELNAGSTFDTSAVPDNTLDASFVDMSKLVGALGGRFGLGGGFSLAAHWTQVFYFERTTKPSTPATPPTRVPSTAGTYTQSIGLLTLSAQYEF